eukprot:7384931-Prymnesium_polylepis.1
MRPAMHNEFPRVALAAKACDLASSTSTELFSCIHSALVATGPTAAKEALAEPRSVDAAPFVCLSHLNALHPARWSQAVSQSRGDIIERHAFGLSDDSAYALDGLRATRAAPEAFVAPVMPVAPVVPAAVVAGGRASGGGGELVPMAVAAVAEAEGITVVAGGTASGDTLAEETPAVTPEREVGLAGAGTDVGPVTTAPVVAVVAVMPMEGEAVAAAAL